jgi:hypothetical protein
MLLFSRDGSPQDERLRSIPAPRLVCVAHPDLLHHHGTEVIRLAAAAKASEARLAASEARLASESEILRRQAADKAYLDRTLTSARTRISHLVAALDRQAEQFQVDLALARERIVELGAALHAREQDLGAAAEAARRTQWVSTELDALCTWNMVSGQNHLATTKRFSSLSKFCKLCRYYVLRYIGPRAVREMLSILERQLGIDGTEVLYGRSYKTIGMSALQDIAYSPFWQDLVVPLDKTRFAPGLFDINYYADHNPNICDSNMSPLRHYVTIGAARGRDPHPDFRSRSYLAQYPDIASTGINPLFHFVNWGRREGRNAHLLFDQGTTAGDDDSDPCGGQEKISERSRRSSSATAEPVTSKASTDRQKASRWIATRIRHSLLFDPLDYLSINKDVKDAAIDPHEHYVQHGCRERRRTITPFGAARKLQTVQACFQQVGAAYLAEFEAAQQDQPSVGGFARSRTFAVVCHSAANYYMWPIADALRHALQSAGADCQLVTEKDHLLRETDVPIIVAPHEFFTQHIPDSFRDDKFLTRTVLYNTEQLTSPWFHEGVSYLYRAKAVMDVNFQTSQIIGSKFPATHILPPFDLAQARDTLRAQDPDHGLFRWVDRAVFGWRDHQSIANRHFDVFFAGFKTDGRNKFFVNNAEYLAQKECFLAYTSTPNKPQPLSERNRCIFANNLAVTRNTKVVLNLHRYPLGFFEWERMVVQGFSSRACVVGTIGLPSPFFTPGIHYFETVSRNIDKILRWILDSEEGIAAAEAAASAAQKVLYEQLTAKRVGQYMLSFLARL